MSNTKNTNTDRLDLWNEAADILNLKPKLFFGGVENCEFSLEQLTHIIDIGFLLLDFKFNNSPMVKEFYEFGKRANQLGATIIYIGFLESNYRADALLVITGIKITNFPDSMMLAMDFAQTFHKADEFTANPDLLRAWYD